MALLIDKNVTVLGGIDLSELYVRLIVGYGPQGSPLTIQTKVYASKAAYEENPSNEIQVDGVTLLQYFSYNRESDGVDAMGFAHNTIKTLLSTDEMVEVPVLDPSTGEPTYDPSTGDPITEEVVGTPKFCQDSSISFVDVSIG